MYEKYYNKLREELNTDKVPSIGRLIKCTPKHKTS